MTSVTIAGRTFVVGRRYRGKRGKEVRRFCGSRREWREAFKPLTARNDQICNGVGLPWVRYEYENANRFYVAVITTRAWSRWAGDEVPEMVEESKR